MSALLISIQGQKETPRSYDDRIFQKLEIQEAIRAPINRRPIAVGTVLRITPIYVWVAHLLG